MSKLLGPRDGWGLFFLGLGFVVMLVIAIFVSYWARIVPSSDLAAQQSMALAGWAMTVVTLLSLGIGIWSVWLIRANLVEARKVTLEAARSAKAAEDAVAEAQRTTKKATKLGMKQARAYMDVIDVAYNFSTGELEIRYVNSGQTPAKQVTIDYRIELTTPGEEPNSPQSTIVVDQRSSHRPPVPAGHNGSFSGRLDVDLDDFRYRHIVAGRARTRARGLLRYMDVFGELRAEEFDYGMVIGTLTHLDVMLALDRLPDELPER